VPRSYDFYYLGLSKVTLYRRERRDYLTMSRPKTQTILVMGSDLCRTSLAPALRARAWVSGSTLSGQEHGHAPGVKFS
jgi:hypothetical protein